MFKKTISYVDYNDTERTETFFFNLTKAELTEMELSTEGGLETYIKRIVEAQDTKALIAIFKDLILRSYGVKSDDGRRFIKSDALREECAQTAAYSDLFMELATDDKAASAFINGILPRDIQQELSNNPSVVPIPTTR